MKDKLISLIESKFAAAVTHLLSVAAVTWFGVSEATANDVAGNAGKALAAVVAVMLSAGLEAFKQRLANRQTKEIVRAIETGKDAEDPKIVDLDVAGCHMSEATKAKVKKIRDESRIVK